jgi:hypothetical protein
MFSLDEFERLLKRPGVKRYTLAQCRFGADAEKLTDLVSNRDLSELELTCNHPPVWWRIPWCGKWIHSPHAPLKGRQRAIRAEEWSPDMLEDNEPTGPYLTRAYAAYPAGLNEPLAGMFKQWLSTENDQAISTTGLEQSVSQQLTTGKLDTKFTMQPKLRLGQQKPAPDHEQWSLRNVFNSMTGKTMLIGRQLSNLIERELTKAPRGGEDHLGKHWQGSWRCDHSRGVVV